MRNGSHHVIASTGDQKLGTNLGNRVGWTSGGQSAEEAGIRIEVTFACGNLTLWHEHKMMHACLDWIHKKKPCTKGKRTAYKDISTIAAKTKVWAPCPCGPPSRSEGPSPRFATRARKVLQTAKTKSQKSGLQHTEGNDAHRKKQCNLRVGFKIEILDFYSVVLTKRRP